MYPWKQMLVAPRAAWTSLLVAGMAHWLCLELHRWQRKANLHSSSGLGLLHGRM
jgi:hypothetical protein